MLFYIIVLNLIKTIYNDSNLLHRPLISTVYPSTIDRAIDSFRYSLKRIRNIAEAADIPANEVKRREFTLFPPVLNRRSMKQKVVNGRSINHIGLVQ